MHNKPNTEIETTFNGLRVRHCGSTYVDDPPYQHHRLGTLSRVKREASVDWPLGSTPLELAVVDCAV